MQFQDNFSKLDFPLIGLVKLPTVKITDQEKLDIGLKPEDNNLQYLKKLAWLGFLEREKKNNINREQARERLKTEFDVFQKTGTIDYILLIFDIIKWCDANNITRGPGRGSCAASFAFYCLGITYPNPIRFNLTFTRFISEARVKPKIIDNVIYADGKLLMDVDLDISYNDREKVIKYIENTYPGSVCKISNRIGLSPKVALKDALKIYLGFEESEAKHVSDNIEILFGKSDPLAKTRDKSEEIKKWLEKSEKHKIAYQIACGLENLNNAKGQHASGIFISSEPLDGNVPVELSSKSKEITTGYDMEIAAQIGVKVDILGLRTLDVIKLTCDKVDIKYKDIDINDNSIYQYYATSDLYYGLFQIEEGLTKEVIKKVKPQNIDHLSVCLAISRPGALKYVDDFAKYVNHGTLKPIHPDFDRILSETGNILVYQEQVNRILQEIYSFSATEAEDTRRVIGKKVKEEMGKLEPVLYERGDKNGIPRSVTKYFWDVCNASADYLFNAAHSVSYAFITAYTTYLKAKYPKEFLMGLLKMSKHETKPLEALANIMSESKKMDINILAPDLMDSDKDFTINKNGDIRFGISYIKGISETTIDNIMKFRKDYQNKFDVFEGAIEAKVRINVLAGLIYSGAINSLGMSRAYMAFEAQFFNCLTDKEKRYVKNIARIHGKDDLIEIINYMKSNKDENNKVYIKETRLETLRAKYKPFYDIYQSNNKNEDLCAYMMERYFLGFSFSHTIESIFSKKVTGLRKIEKVLEFPKETKQKIVGFASEIKQALSKNNNPYLKMDLTDETSTIRVMLFGNKIEQCKDYHGGQLPEENDLIIVEGTKADGAAIFADQIYIQSMPIKISKRDLDKVEL